VRNRALESLEVLSNKVEDFKLENKLEIKPTLILLIVNNYNLFYVFIDEGY
jgi:hypothetical protein